MEIYKRHYRKNWSLDPLNVEKKKTKGWYTGMMKQGISLKERIQASPVLKNTKYKISLKPLEWDF